MNSTAIWEEIQAVLRETSAERQDGEKTINELCEEWGVKRGYARSVIDRLVKAGVLLRRAGANRSVYLRPNPDAPDVEQEIRKALAI